VGRGQVEVSTAELHLEGLRDGDANGFVVEDHRLLKRSKASSLSRVSGPREGPSFRGGTLARG